MPDFTVLLVGSNQEKIAYIESFAVDGDTEDREKMWEKFEENFRNDISKMSKKTLADLEDKFAKIIIRESKQLKPFHDNYYLERAITQSAIDVITVLKNDKTHPETIENELGIDAILKAGKANLVQLRSQEQPKHKIIELKKYLQESRDFFATLYWNIEITPHNSNERINYEKLLDQIGNAKDKLEESSLSDEEKIEAYQKIGIKKKINDQYQAIIDPLKTLLEEYKKTSNAKLSPKPIPEITKIMDNNLSARKKFHALKQINWPEEKNLEKTPFVLKIRNLFI